MSRFFTSLGAFVVRFRFLVVAAWIVGTLLAVQFLPSLSSVAKDTTSGFLPADSPSMQAAALAAPFQDTSLAAAQLVAARDTGLTQADGAALDQLEGTIRGIKRVRRAAASGFSAEGRARQALAQANAPSFSPGPDASAVGDGIGNAFRSAGLPAGLEVHLA